MVAALVPETTAHSDGVSPAVRLSGQRAQLLVLTLGVNSLVECDSILVSIWGSSDGDDWGVVPTTSFPRRFYCGVHSILLNLAARPEIQFLRARWNLRGTTEGDRPPVCEFYILAEASGFHMHEAAA